MRVKKGAMKEATEEDDLHKKCCKETTKAREKKSLKGSTKKRSKCFQEEIDVVYHKSLYCKRGEVMFIELVFAQWIQDAHTKASYGFDVLLSSGNILTINASQSLWLPSWLDAINNNIAIEQLLSVLFFSSINFLSLQLSICLIFLPSHYPQLCLVMSIVLKSQDPWS